MGKFFLYLLLFIVLAPIAIPFFMCVWIVQHF